MRDIQRKFWVKENVWVLLLSYVLTILISRVAMYFSCVVYQVYCGSVFRGVHYHHYAWGYALLVAGILLYKLDQHFSSIITLGIGAGFIADELLMQAFPRAVSYWEPVNLIPIAAVLVLLNVIFLLVGDEDKNNSALDFDLEHFTRKLGFLARFAEAVFFSRIGPHRYDRYSVTRVGYVVTLAVFLFIVLFVIYAAQERLEDRQTGFLHRNGTIMGYSERTMLA